MNVVFMGTPDFAVPTLAALCEKHNVTAVVSQPDKPKGRGKKLLPTPVKEFALNKGIEVFQPEKIKDEQFIEKLSEIAADVFVVVAYGQILPESVLNMPKYGCINVHGSLLPKYRGAAPIQQAIIDGQLVTGITVMYMEKGLDTGDMILKSERKIDPDDTYGTLSEKLSKDGASLLIQALELIESGKAKPEKQNDELSTYAGKITKEMGHINFNKTSDEIINLIRAFNPDIGAYAQINDEIFKIWQAEKIDKKYSGENGEIVDFINKKGFIVKTGDCAIHITQIQAKGGKKMNTADYLRGHSLEKGICLK
jgi:methionyl-tRNA formyltransferase